MLRFLLTLATLVALTNQGFAQFSINGITLLDGNNPPTVTGADTDVSTNVGATVHVVNGGPVAYEIQIRLKATGAVVGTVGISNPYNDNIAHGLAEGAYDIYARAAGSAGAWTDIGDITVDSTPPAP